MAKWELAIAIKDENDLPSGHKRKKEGDIIAYKPAPWNWGKVEVKTHLIVPIDGLTEEEVMELCEPEYDNGKKLSEMTQEEQMTAKPVKKRRYSLPLDNIKNGWIKDMDLNRVANPEEEYQPIKDNKIEINMKEDVRKVYDRKTGTFDSEKIKTVV